MILEEVSPTDIAASHAASHAEDYVLGPWAASWARQTRRRYACFGDPSMVTLAYMRLASQHIYTSNLSNSMPALRAAA
jgi:hypothetical protein